MSSLQPSFFMPQFLKKKNSSIYILKLLHLLTKLINLVYAIDLCCMFSYKLHFLCRSTHIELHWINSFHPLGFTDIVEEVKICHQLAVLSFKNIQSNSNYFMQGLLLRILKKFICFLCGNKKIKLCEKYLTFYYYSERLIN